MLGLDKIWVEIRGDILLAMQDRCSITCVFSLLGKMTGWTTSLIALLQWLRALHSSFKEIVLTEKGFFKDHPSTCMCAVRKCPKHTHNGFILDKRGPQNTQMHIQFTWEVCDNYFRRLTWGETPRHDNTPNDIIKTLPTQCHDLLFLFF